jgi:hypothetical protein
MEINKVYKIKVDYGIRANTCIVKYLGDNKFYFYYDSDKHSSVNYTGKTIFLWVGKIIEEKEIPEHELAITLLEVS